MPRLPRSEKFVFPASSWLPPFSLFLKIVDVGAMSLGEGTEPYAALMNAIPCGVYGFEPIAAECEKLNALKKRGHHYLPYFIGDGSVQTFHECNYPMTSSLFEPDTELMARFHHLEELCRVTKSYPVETTRLDDIKELKEVDLLKVDVQGGELLVFRGAVQMLRHVLVVHTEVEFVPIYKRQPLFADIDSFLRSQGFVFHLLWTQGRRFKPLVLNQNVNAPLQILWGDAVYVWDFMAFDQLPPNALIKLAAILHLNYHSFDLAALALEAYDHQTNSELLVAYQQRLNAGRL
jgi:FkbM family methyltransferase